jgi:hypothetical protein
MPHQSCSSIPKEHLYVQLQSSEKGLSQAIANKRIREQLKYFKKESRFIREFKLLIRQFFNPLMFDK